MRRIFVSYSRTNLDVVSQLIQDLKAVGIDTWHDQALSGGQRWWNDILAQIRNCDIFIFAVSSESLASEACKSEVAYVAQLGKTILPVLVADGININLLSPPLNEIQITDYRRHDKDAAFALVKAIYVAPEAAAPPDPLPPPPPVPISYLATLKERIDASDQLTAQTQIALLFELEEGLTDGRSPAEIRDLLLSLRRRDDLLAKIAVKIDAALKTVEDNAVNKSQEDNRAGFPALHPSTPAKRSNGHLSEEKTCRDDSDSQPEMPELSGEGAASTGLNTKGRKYACEPGDSPRLIADVRNWLDGQGFDCQQLALERRGILLQIKKRGAWRDFVGMSTSLNIAFRQSRDVLTVEIGAGKWLDKAIAGTVSIFVLWPLAVTAGLGAWEQTRMPEKIFGYISSRLTASRDPSHGLKPIGQSVKGIA